MRDLILQLSKSSIYSTKPLLGKVYEMKGENRLAADSYITAFNLRPGEDTLYWIENGVFQTSVNRVVPYLDNFLSSE